MKTKQILTTIAIVPALLLSSCAGGINDALIQSGISVGTVSALKYTIKDASKRTVIANYLNVVASALRTVTGSPTPEQLTALLVQSIPAQIRSDYPELLAFVTPLVVSAYQLAYQKYGPNAVNRTKILYQVLNDIAFGLESGSAPYISQHPSVTVTP